MRSSRRNCRTAWRRRTMGWWSKWGRSRGTNQRLAASEFPILKDGLGEALCWSTLVHASALCPAEPTLQRENRAGGQRAGDGHGCGLNSTPGGPLMANDHAATLRRFQNPAVRQSAALDDLVRQAVFGSGPEREEARWLIWEIGQHAGVRPASIHELYLARGRGEVAPFTTPAMNLRVVAYDTARAVFRAAQRLDVGALICEIARSEIGYTEQRPAEYVAVMTAAALREGFP